MRALSILTAAAIGLAASFGIANAQTGNAAPKSGAAAGKKATAKPRKANPGASQRATGQRVRSSPALDHAGNPGYE
jgi:hypothetical protein